MFTGSYGASTGIISHFHPPAQLAAQVPWLPSLLHDEGCRTGAVDHLFVMKEWFEPRLRGLHGPSRTLRVRRLPSSTSSRSPGSTDNADDDFFLFLHYWDTHIPYVPEEPFRSRYTWESGRWVDLGRDGAASEHAAVVPVVQAQPRTTTSTGSPTSTTSPICTTPEVAYLDHELGRLFGHLADLEIVDECMIVIFGDHGEIMTEHDAWFDHARLSTPSCTCR